MNFEDSCWNVSMPGLLILAAAVFEIPSGKTDRQTNVAENRSPATTVGVRSKTCVVNKATTLSKTALL